MDILFMFLFIGYAIYQYILAQDKENYSYKYSKEHGFNIYTDKYGNTRSVKTKKLATREELYGHK